MRVLFILSVWLIGVLFCAGAEQRFRVAAKINGRPAKLIFDTGTEGLILYQEAAKRLGVKADRPVPDVPDRDGKVVVGLSEETDVECLGKSFRTAFHLINEGSEFLNELDGLIGWKPVRNNIFVIDGRTSTFQTLASVPEEVLQWQKFHVLTNRDDLVLQAADGTRWMIDTGASDPTGVVLPQAVWDEWKKRHPQAPGTLNYYFMHGSGNVLAEVAWAEEMQVGPLKLDRLPVRVANFTETKSIERGELSGNLGVSALARLDLVVDGKNNIAYVRPKKSSPPEVSHNRLGAVFFPTGSEALMATVITNSPAYKAGIRDGDQLLKINDDEAVNLRTNRKVIPLAFNWLEPADRAYLLTIKRKAATPEATDRVFTVFVELKNILRSEAKKADAKADLVAEAKWYVWLGKLAFGYRSYKDAASYYRESLRLDPTHLDALIGAGQSYNAQIDPDSALEYFERARKLKPDSEAAWSGRGQSLVLADKYVEALPAFDRAIQLNPTNATALGGRGVAHYNLGNITNSLADLDRAIQLDPGEANNFRYRGTVRRFQGAPELALADFTEAIRLAPEDMEARVQRSYAYHQLKQYSQVIAEAQTMVRMQPDSIQWQYNLAWVLASCPDPRVRDAKEAIEQATKACEMTGWQEFKTKAVLAAAYAAAGDFNEAVKWQKESLKMNQPEEGRKEGERRLKLYLEKKPYSEP